MSETLPMGWVETELGEIAQIVGGSTPKNSSESSNFEQNGIPWITPSDLTGYEETYISRGRRDLSQKGFISCGTKKLPKGSVLFSSRAPIGYCVIAEDEVCTNQGFKSFVLFEGIISEFLRYYLITSKSYIESVASGTTFKEISASRIATVPFPLPPLNEQRRIANKLDALMARSRNAKEELDRIPKLVTRYKQAVLAAAFRGDLTADWRGTSELVGWKEKALHDLGLWNGGGTPSKAKSTYWTNGTIPWISPKDMKSYFITSATDFITSEAVENSSTKLIPQNSVLIVTRSGILEHTLPVAINMQEVTVNQDLKAITPYADIVPKYLLYLLKGFSQDILSKCGKAGTTVANLNTRLLQEYKVSIPPHKEQELIVERIEAAFKSIDALFEEVAKAEKLRVRLEQATLAKAFRGELIPQDPNDEPASVLLERIRAERENKPKEKKQPLKNKITRSKGSEIVEKQIDLVAILQEYKQLEPERLFELSAFEDETIEDFYASLKQAVLNNKIEEVRTEEKVFLQLKK